MESYTHTHASNREEIRKDRNGEKREQGERKNGTMGMKSDREFGVKLWERKLQGSCEQ